MESDMRIEVRLIRQTISPMDLFAGLRSKGGDGAWAEFTGIVRGEEHGRPIEALEYEAYESMAPKVLREILAKLGKRHHCSGVGVIHRLGIIPVGEAAIWVGVASPHRHEALALLTEFMDELKRDVPIWKRRALVTVPTP
jgi:molybdopterin synthase catalytic subunit